MKPLKNPRLVISARRNLGHQMKSKNVFMQETSVIIPAAFFTSKNVKIVILRVLSIL